MAILEPLRQHLSTRLLATAEPDEVGLSAERLGRLSAIFQREIDRKRLPGVVALVARRGKVAYCESLGVRDPASGASMSQDTIFRIYSMTKPIVSVAVMMLLEQGRLLLSDPLHKFLTAFSDMKVARYGERGDVELIPAERPITIQDLLRHTSGLTYEFIGTGPVPALYNTAKVFRHDQTNAEHAATLAGLPLAYQPGTRWDYSRSTDVLGRVIEVISGQSLREFLNIHLMEPLGMVDTDFFAPPEKQDRLAEPFSSDPDSGEPVRLINVRTPPRFESGGGGLVSTVMDYARFCQMLANGGCLGSTRLLSRKTVEFMTADHLGGIKGTSDLLAPGYGFGLGFTVRLVTGPAQVPGSVGHYGWGGIAGTTFWVDPLEDFFAIMMMQGPGQRDYFRPLFRGLVYAAFED
jgi:CubicO group peptidase (beta-lactamase class C family)